MQREHTAVIHSRLRSSPAPKKFPAKGIVTQGSYSFSLCCVLTSLLTIDFLHDHRQNTQAQICRGIQTAEIKITWT